MSVACDGLLWIDGRYLIGLAWLLAKLITQVTKLRYTYIYIYIMPFVHLPLGKSGYSVTVISSVLSAQYFGTRSSRLRDVDSEHRTHSLD